MEWTWPPAHWALGEGEVHVWLASLDQPSDIVAACETLLSIDERAKTARMLFAVDRQRAIVARCILRKLLGGYLRCAPDEVSFAYNQYGKPSVAGGRAPYFNLSHSGSVALYAVTALGRIGVDVEEVRPLPDFHDIASRCFTPKEQAAVREGGEAVFFKFWTRNEARAKCDGRGIAHETPADWRVKWVDLDPGIGFAAALATEMTPSRVLTWRWPQSALQR